MKTSKMIEAAVGIYLVSPGLEDIATGGLTLAPSTVLGAALIADSFGVKI